MTEVWCIRVQFAHLIVKPTRILCEKALLVLNDISAPLNCAFTIPKICSHSHDSWSSTKGRLPTPKNSALSGFIYSILLPFCAHFTICKMPSSTSGRRDPFLCLFDIFPSRRKGFVWGFTLLAESDDDQSPSTFNTWRKFQKGKMTDGVRAYKLLLFRQ